MGRCRFTESLISGRRRWTSPDADDRIPFCRLRKRGAYEETSAILFCRCGSAVCPGELRPRADPDGWAYVRTNERQGEGAKCAGDSIRLGAQLLEAAAEPVSGGEHRRGEQLPASRFRLHAQPANASGWT